MLRRFSAFLLSFFFCLTLLVPSALADDGFTSSGGSDFENDYGVRWSGYVDDGSKTGVFVKAPDMWSAAVYACGGNPGLLSAEVRSKLSDPSYGGRFYAYAQSFGHIMSVSEIPNWVPLYILAAEGIANVWHGEFGDMLLWSSKVPNSLITGALVDFRRVLAGDDLSGGSGGSSSGIPSGYYYYFDIEPNFNDFPADVPFTKIYFEKEHWDTVMSNRPSSKYIPYVLMYMRKSNGTSTYGYEFFTYLSATSSSISYRDARYNSNKTVVTQDGALYEYGDGLPVWKVDGVGSSSNSNVTVYAAYPLYVSDATVVYIGEPNGDWPESDTPVVPTAPQIPAPTAPTVVTDPTVTEPTVIWPDIDITVNPPAVVVPTTPDGLDYTELLTRINDNLESIDSYTVAINSNLNSLRGDLVSEFQDLISSIRNIYTYLQHLDNILELHCKHLRDALGDAIYNLELYIKSLFEWLTDQLNYDSEFTFDDSLLTTINEKLGGGTYEPNPIKDELGYYEWLDDLWERFLLGDDWESSVSSISASFGQLRTRFPFSIPWDIVALFRLFVHEPVTPVFDLPLYFSGSSSTPVRVDLTSWDGVASVVRPLIYVIFALKLALLSRDLLAGLGADKGGLS